MNCTDPLDRKLVSWSEVVPQESRLFRRGERKLDGKGNSMSVKKTFWTHLVMVLLLGWGTSLFASGPAHAQGTIKNTFGDWKLRCDNPPGASTEQCLIMQNVADEARPNITLVMFVMKTADGKSRLMRILVPLGVLLPNGLGLKIDQVDIGRVGFVRCLTTGCVAEVILEEGLVAQLKKGHTATFIVFATPEEGVGIPLSLEGFEAAYDSLP